MALVELYPDLLRALNGPGPVWSRLSPTTIGFLAGLEATYGPETFGPAGVPGALDRLAAPLLRAIAPAAGYGLAESARALLHTVTPLLPGRPADLYLGTLLFIAPAGTVNVGGQPAIAVGLERFHSVPPQGGEKIWYHPSEIAEMIPHEAAHAARMQVLGLPPTPRVLSLLDMVMLEGTALTFTDLLLGRETLATFMPADRLAWHRAHDDAVRTHVAAEFANVGMEPFRRYFAVTSPVSGYYVGYSLCRQYLDRYGPAAVRELVALPSREILRRLYQAPAGLA